MIWIAIILALAIGFFIGRIYTTYRVLTDVKWEDLKSYQEMIKDIEES